MEEIRHKAVVESVDPQFTRVKVVIQEACSQCRAKSMCSMGMQKTDILELPTDPYEIHNVGDEVEVCAKTSMGMKAVWVCYVLPLLVLMAAIAVLYSCGANDLVTGAGALSCVALYYCVLFLFRNKIGKEVVFYIK